MKYATSTWWPLLIMTNQLNQPRLPSIHLVDEAKSVSSLWQVSPLWNKQLHSLRPSICCSLIEQDTVALPSAPPQYDKMAIQTSYLHTIIQLNHRPKNYV
jgi:hypothetical protein